MVKQLIIALIVFLLLPCLANAAVLVFVSDWCSGCKQVHKDAISLQKDGYDITIINISEDKDAVKKYNITSVPTTIVVYSNGKEVSRKIGPISKEELRLKSIEDGINYDDLLKANNFTGILHFYTPNTQLDKTNKLIFKFALRFNRFGYKEIDITSPRNKDLVEKYNITKSPTMIILEKGGELGRYVATIN
jgi:thiol-disulfide isomerase/thioredoxin